MALRSYVNRQTVWLCFPNVYVRNFEIEIFETFSSYPTAKFYIFLSQFFLSVMSEAMNFFSGLYSDSEHFDESTSDVVRRKKTTKAREESVSQQQSTSGTNIGSYVVVIRPTPNQDPGANLGPRFVSTPDGGEALFGFKKHDRQSPVHSLQDSTKNFGFNPSSIFPFS